MFIKSVLVTDLQSYIQSASSSDITIEFTKLEVDSLGINEPLIENLLEKIICIGVGSKWLVLTPSLTLVECTKTGVKIFIEKQLNEIANNKVLKKLVQKYASMCTPAKILIINKQAQQIPLKSLIEYLQFHVQCQSMKLARERMQRYKIRLRLDAIAKQRAAETH